MVSIERIYQFIRQDKSNVGVIYKNLHHKLKHKKRIVGADKSKIKDRTSIDLHPDKVNNRKEFGTPVLLINQGKVH